MITELNDKNARELKRKCKVYNMDLNTLIETMLENKTRLQYEIYIREERLENIHYKMEDIKENNINVIEGTVIDEYYELEKEKDKLNGEINLLKYLFEELV